MFLDAINVYIQAIVWHDYFVGNPILQATHNKGIYAIACFLIWVKIYGLMRIFADYAHFITVIFEIVGEIRVFMVMLFILMLAFANYFYVIDDVKGANYMDRTWDSSTTDVSFLDNLLEVYLISLGDFSV